MKDVLNTAYITHVCAYVLYIPYKEGLTKHIYYPSIKDAITVIASLLEMDQTLSFQLYNEKTNKVILNHNLKG